MSTKTIRSTVYVIKLRCRGKS